MSRKRYTPEQIIGKLREAEVALAQGETVGQVCRSLGIAEQTFYRWRREYGGLKVEQARRLKALEQFKFRRLHPLVRMGTASDRYAGWLGQIYTASRYPGAIKNRPKLVGDQTFTEQVLPVESVAEYFEHFPVLEIDFTFYRSLLDQDGKPTPTFQTLKAYQRHLRDGDALLLKVPQAVTAPKLRRGGQFRDNLAYLQADFSPDQFYERATNSWVRP
jgi:hypothetical protein